jgi:hypothetical protein
MCCGNDQATNIDWSNVSFTDAAARPLKRQRRMAAIMCAQLSLPLILASVMFVYMYFNGRAMLDDVAQQTDVSYAQCRRKVRQPSRRTHPYATDAAALLFGAWCVCCMCRWSRHSCGCTWCSH